MRYISHYSVLFIILTLLLICTGSIAVVSGSNTGISPISITEGTKNHVFVDFFYDPSCESCQKVLPFIKQYEANSSLISVNYYNIAVDNSSFNRFTQIQKNLGDVHVPFVYIGDQYLTGLENITGNFDILVKKSTETVNKPSSIPSEFVAPPANNTPDTNYIQFFYSPTCGSCQKVLPLIQDYTKSHPDTIIGFNDISGNKTSIERFEQFRSMFPGETIYVPVVFVGDTLLQGEENITSNFNSTVESYKKNSSINLSVSRNRVEEVSSINPVVLLVAAIGEGLNPCGLLVLALLLVSLMTTGSRRMVLFVGTAYICAFFLVRLLSGFAIFSVIQIPGIANAFTLFAAFIAILAGAIQIKDGLSKKKKPLLSIPESKKGLISTYMKKASIPGGFIVGVLVGIYGMACTAGIYISILGMLYKDLTSGLFYLILYNFIVIIPLIAILLLVFFGLPPEKVNAWREERKSQLRLAVGIIMVLMGIIILIPWLT